MTEEALLRSKLDAYNALPGPEGCEPCQDCLGKGQIAVEREGRMALKECHCAARRRTLARVRRSGLGELYERCTLDGYRAETPWQRHLKDNALDYIRSASGWFFVCGRSGSGKTHLTAAIARALILSGMEARYLMWRQDAPRLKALVNERAEYERRMNEYAESQVLLIDDLWKGGNVTDADINLTFELLNARYNTPSRLTLISSECSAQDILRIDEAIGGRIIERARGHVLQTEPENLRLSGGA